MADTNTQAAPVTVNVALKFDPKILEDLIVTGIEGGSYGIGYWSPKQRFRAEGQFSDWWDPSTDHGPKDGPEFDTAVTTPDVATHHYDDIAHCFMARNVMLGGTMTFYEDEDEERDESKYTAITLTREKLVAGFQRWLADGRMRPGSIMETDGDIIKDLDLDANDADIILQYALLGEIKYG